MNSILLDTLTSDQLESPAELTAALSSKVAAGAPWLTGVE